MNLIRPNTCKTCKHSRPLPPGPPGAPTLACHRFPPIGGPIAVPVQAGIMQVQFPTMWPPVPPDEDCGEYAPRLAIAAHEMQAPLPSPPDNGGPVSLTALLNKERAAA